MKKSYRTLAAGIIGLIIVTVTLCIFFLLDFQKTTVSWWALFFILLSDVSLFLGLIMLESREMYINKIFVHSGVPLVLFVYFIISNISALFAGTFEDNINNFIIIQIVVIAATAITVILIITFSEKINITDQKTLSEYKLMATCEKNVYNLLVDTKNKKYEKQLKALYESIRYGDKLGSSSLDEKIVTEILNLEKVLQSKESLETDINNIFDEVSTFMTQRKMEVAQSKRGGF